MRVRDQYAPDGIIACGERLVRKGGKVFFGGYTATHPSLIQWVGKMVFVHVECYYFQNVHISAAEDYCRRICTAPVEHRKRIISQGKFTMFNCPQCGEPTETLNEGCCEKCRCQNQRRLDAHNISFDRWESLSDQEREQEIKLAKPCSFGI